MLGGMDEPTQREFYVEFTCKPGRETMFPEMTGSCVGWEDARQSMIDFANTDLAVNGARIEIDGVQETWAKTSNAWEKVASNS